MTEELIFELVDAFYDRARTDPALGPIFNRVINDAWAAHIAKMCDFWSAVMLGTGRYKGVPVEAHLRIPELRPTHFGRWLYLFRQTAREICPPDAASAFITRAELIAQNLQAALALARREAERVGAPEQEPAP